MKLYKTSSNKILDVGAFMMQLIWLHVKSKSRYLSRMRFSQPSNMNVLPSSGTKPVSAHARYANMLPIGDSGTKHLNIGLCINPGPVVINLFHAELNCWQFNIHKHDKHIFV